MGAQALQGQQRSGSAVRAMYLPTLQRSSSLCLTAMAMQNPSFLDIPVDDQISSSIRCTTEQVHSTADNIAMQRNARSLQKL